MADSNVRSIMNLGNSIVGVSILAMPYCFSQCGIMLGTLLLIVCTLFTQWTCKMLMKGAVLNRNQTYENLALGVLGPMGKYFTGIIVIGLNLGTCIAFFVIIGDLAPPIIAQAIGVQWNSNYLRAVVLFVAAVVVVFPLGLLRSVDSLSGISVASLVFYAFLAFQLFLNCFRTASWGWWYEVSWWDSSGLLKCIPIFALAFSCQTQLFIIYSALQDSGFRRIANVINGATIAVASLYFLVALFGYISFYSAGVKGDILANFDLGFFPQLSRFGFSVSVMVSFPLMIFPCRVSINSLFFSNKSNELHVLEPIPQKRFVAITTFIIVSTLAVAILVPNVETVLSLTGATMGTLISFIIPSVIFLKVSVSNADYSKRAKLCVLVGLSVMILSTTTIIQTEMNNVSSNYEVIKPMIKPIEIVKQVNKPTIPDIGRKNSEHHPDVKGKQADGLDSLNEPGAHLGITKAVSNVGDKVAEGNNQGLPDTGKRKNLQPVIQGGDGGDGRGNNGQPEGPGRNGGQQLGVDGGRKENRNDGQHLEGDNRKVEAAEDKNRNGGQLGKAVADQKNMESNQAGAGQLHQEQRPNQKEPLHHQEPELRGGNGGNVDSKGKEGVLEQPSRTIKPDALDGKAGKEDDGEVHNRLRNDVSKLHERLNKLEEENQNLKQRQEAIEGIQVEKLLDGDGQPAGDVHQGGAEVDVMLNAAVDRNDAGGMHNEVVGRRTILEAGNEDKQNVQHHDADKGGGKGVQDRRAESNRETRPEKPIKESGKDKRSADDAAVSEVPQVQETSNNSSVQVEQPPHLNHTSLDVLEHVKTPLKELVGDNGKRVKAGQRDLKTVQENHNPDNA